jgi:hypothetical protein
MHRELLKQYRKGTQLSAVSNDAVAGQSGNRLLHMSAFHPERTFGICRGASILRLTAEKERRVVIETARFLRIPVRAKA